MQFVKTHLTRHHLLHKPHRWFMAFLMSPIHLAEMHYKNKYHLNFKHAKKLFVFDMTLLVSIILLITASLCWYYYNPDVVDQIDLSLNSSSSRIISGDYVTYSIKYKNNSDEKLVDVMLFLNLPPGFIVDKIEPIEIYQEKNHSFDLKELLKNEAGGIAISGWYYDTPHQETHVTTELIYRQEERKTKEVKMVNLIQIHRDSYLELVIEANDSILNAGTIPIQLKLINNGQQTIKGISLPLNLNTGLELSDFQTDQGEIKANHWLIDKIDPGEEIILNAQLKSQLSTNDTKADLIFTPEITVNDVVIKQNTTNKELSILHPRLELTAVWDNTAGLSPGEKITLNLNIKNQGDTTLNNLQIYLPIPVGLVNSDLLTSLNPGTWRDNTFFIDKNSLPNLDIIKPGETKEVNLSIPISSYPQGSNDLLLSLFPRIKSEVTNLPGANFETSTETQPIKIGTQLNLKAESRYYTAEGDQLGRGSLPPQVDKETKYWILLRLENTTSKVSDVNLTAILPDYITWTGKSSVSLGADVSFNSNSRIISWSTNNLNPHETAGIYFEVALTPTANQIGTTPVLVQNIQVTTQDDYINKEIVKYAGNVDSSLESDVIGKKKGVEVK
ncbi:MAG: hypothetical protein ABIJ23_03290 [Candidatus Magasanikbacteria bacterium]